MVAHRRWPCWRCSSSAPTGSEFHLPFGDGTRDPGRGPVGGAADRGTAVRPPARPERAGAGVRRDHGGRRAARARQAPDGRPAPAGQPPPEPEADRAVRADDAATCRRRPRDGGPPAVAATARLGPADRPPGDAASRRGLADASALARAASRGAPAPAARPGSRRPRPCARVADARSGPARRRRPPGRPRWPSPGGTRPPTRRRRRRSGRPRSLPRSRSPAARPRARWRC